MTAEETDSALYLKNVSMTAKSERYKDQYIVAQATERNANTAKKNELVWKSVLQPRYS